MYPSQPSKENGQPPADETVTVTDEIGRTLECSIEHSFELDGQDYLLLMPLDIPVEIFGWDDNDDNDDNGEDEAIPIEDETKIDELFPIAKAVLEEQNLNLKRTAVILTVEGDLPDWVDEEEETTNSNQNGDVYEELQWLATFYKEEEEYGIYTPLDPFFVLARVDENGKPQLLSPEEFKQIEPMLPAIEDMIEDNLFE